MPNTQEQEKKTFIVIHRDSIEWLEREINKKLSDWYSLYWELHCHEKIYMQSMMLTTKVPALKVSVSWWSLKVTGIDWVVKVQES